MSDTASQAASPSRRSAVDEAFATVDMELAKLGVAAMTIMDRIVPALGAGEPEPVDDSAYVPRPGTSTLVDRLHSTGANIATIAGSLMAAAQRVEL